MTRPLALALAFGLATVAAAQPSEDVPVERVILFTSGVGYFEHSGRVDGDAEVVLRFDEAALNDVLKSLLVEDTRGRVAGVVYPTQAPVERTLRSFAIDLSGGPDLAGILKQVRGAEVVVQTPSGTTRGTVVSVETAWKDIGDGVGGVPVLTLLTQNGLVTIRLDTARNLQFTDASLRDELEAALTALGEDRGGERKPVRVQFRGDGPRPVRLGYVVESPVWKTSYRLVLPEGEQGEGLLQGWALVENPTESDWRDVDLTLVSGRPVSFVQDLYTPRYLPRPVVEAEDDALVGPQTYAAGVGREAGSPTGRVRWRAGGAAGTVSGQIRTASGDPLPGAAVRLAGSSYGAATDREGRYQITGVPAGAYELVVSFVGFNSASARVELGASGVVADAELSESVALSELTVRGDRAAVQQRAVALGVTSSYELSNTGETPRPIQLRGAPPPPPPAAPAAPIAIGGSAQAQGDAGDFGELFAYRLGDVTLPRRGSAMLPIVTDDVTAERLSIYRAGDGLRHPMRGARLVNGTDKALRAGPATVLDEGYAGDTQIPDMPPGAERLLTFALDQDVILDPVPLPDGSVRVVTGAIVDGVLDLRVEQRVASGYVVENRADRERTLLIEHPRRGNATLVEPEAPDETAPGVYRVRFTVAAGGLDTLVIREALVQQRQVSLTTQDPNVIAVWARSDGDLPDDVRAALREAAERRRELAETEREIRERTEALREIEREQSRIRNNLNAVNNRSRYGRRLLAKLDAQESQLESLLEAIDGLEEQAERQRDALRVTVR